MEFVTSLEESITFLVNKNYDLKSDFSKTRELIEEECRKTINEVIRQKTEKVNELEVNLKTSVDSNMSIINHLSTRIDKEKFFIINKEYTDFVKFSECGICYSETNVFKTCKCSGLLCSHCFQKIDENCPFCRQTLSVPVVNKMNTIHTKYFINLKCTEKCVTPKARPPLSSPPQLRRRHAFRYTRNLISEFEQP